MKYVIFDIDNCVSDDRDRLKLIDMSKTGNERYEAYHAAHVEDPANNDALTRLISHTLAGERIVFITGRPEVHRRSTIAWLRENIFAHDARTHFDLHMRPMEGPLSGMGSDELKPALISLHGLFQHDIIHAYDDFDSVLDAYRALGIPCTKLCAHEGDSHNLRGDHAASPLVEGCTRSHPHENMDAECLQTTEELRRAALSALGNPITKELWLHEYDEPIAETDKPEPVKVAAAQPSPARKTAADILDAMAATFRERNKVYGSNYLMVAKLVAVLFPNGVPPELVITDQWHLFELKLVKLSRFAISNLTHVDSIHDDGVYSAMIESILQGG